MTPEVLVLVVLGLVVKYTLEFADRRRWRQKPRRRRASRPHPAGLPPQRNVSAVDAASDDPSADDPPAPTGDPFWDMVNARIAALPEDEPAKQAQ